MSPLSLNPAFLHRIIRPVIIFFLDKNIICIKCGNHKNSNPFLCQQRAALKRARNLVPLIAEDGTDTGKKLRLKDPQLKNVEAGVVQLTIEWTSRRPYDATEPLKMQRFKLDYSEKEEP